LIFESRNAHWELTERSTDDSYAMRNKKTATL